MTRKMVKIETFVLNLRDASADTYQTWATIRLMSDGTLERKSNAGGNGQTWELFGYVSESETKLFACNTNEADAARLFAHCVRIRGESCNVGGYGAAWSKATIVAPVVSKATGRRLTAATSIREGKVTRDKNVKQRRWTGSLADMIAARKKGGE